MQKKARISLSVSPTDVISVKVGDVVQPGDSIVSQRVDLLEEFNLCQALNVPPENFEKYLLVHDHAQLNEGDTIAVKQGVFFRTIVRAPHAGEFIIVDKKQGLVGIKKHAESDPLTVWFSGSVDSVDHHAVSFLVSGTLVTGVGGKGKPVSGVLGIVPQVGSLFEMSGQLDGKVLLIAQLTSDLVAKARALGAVGFVTQKGNKHFDFLSVVEVDDMKVLSKFEGKTVIINGDLQQILVLDSVKE